MYTPKSGVELHLLVPYLDVASLLDGESAKQWVQHRIHRLPNVLQQQAVTIGHCTLNLLQVPVDTHTCV